MRAGAVIRSNTVIDGDFSCQPPSKWTPDIPFIPKETRNNVFDNYKAGIPLLHFKEVDGIGVDGLNLI